MRKLGFTHRGVPSISRLADKSGLSVETVRRFIHRIGVPAPETVAALSKVMREDVSSWANVPTAHELYIGPDSSRSLTDRQREALTELINSFVKESSWRGSRRSEDPVSRDNSARRFPSDSKPPRREPSPRSPQVPAD